MSPKKQFWKLIWLYSLIVNHVAFFAFLGYLPCKPDYFKWDFWCLFSLFFTLGGGCLCSDANSQLEQISASGKQISLIGIG